MAYTENDDPITITSTLSITDGDGLLLKSADIGIGAGLSGPGDGDILGFNDVGNITGNYDAEIGVLSLTGTASIVEYEAALRSVTYENSSDDPSTAMRTISYKVKDGTSDSNSVTRDIVVIAVNDAPQADDKSVSVDEDSDVVITLTGSDFEGDSFTFAEASMPANGSLSGIPPDLIYTPNPNFNGLDSFTFTTNDGILGSLVATVAITVRPVNDVPLADDQSIMTNEDTPSAIILRGSDIDEDSLTFSVATQPSNGTLTGSLMYVPNPDFNGVDSFTFTANDGMVDSLAATVAITVNLVNDAPAFRIGPDLIIGMKKGEQTVASWATNITPGPDNELNQDLTFERTGNTNPDLFDVEPTIDAITGDLAYNPNSSGLAEITFVLKDDGGTANGGADTSEHRSFMLIISEAEPEFELISARTADLIGVPRFIDGLLLGFNHEVDRSTVDINDFDIPGISGMFNPQIGDLSMVVTDPIGGNPEENTVLITFDDGKFDTATTPTVTYTPGILADSTGTALRATNLIAVDKAEPVVTEWSLDFNERTMAFNFSELVQPSTLDVKAVTIQDAAEANTSYTLTNSTIAEPVNGAELPQNTSGSPLPGPNLSAGLLAHWPFDDPPGTPSVDLSGNGHHGILPRDVEKRPQSSPGHLNGSLEFDGIDDYLEIPHHDDFLINDGTIAFWVNADSIGQRQGLWSKDSSEKDTGGHLTIWLESTGKISVRLQSTSEDFSLESATTIESQTWVHLGFFIRPFRYASFC